MIITRTGGESSNSLNGKLNFEQDKNRIVGRDPDNNIRLLITSDGTNFNMKVAKDGYDATTATGDQLVFNSDQNILKVVQSGVATLNVLAGATGGLVSVTHGLGYAPASIAYLDQGGGGTTYTPVPTYSINTTGELSASFDVSTTTSTISFGVQLYPFPTNTFASNTQFKFKYYLLQESAS